MKTVRVLPVMVYPPRSGRPVSVMQTGYCEWASRMAHDIEIVFKERSSVKWQHNIMARLIGIWCSVLAVAALASGKAIVTKDLQSDESQVLPLALFTVPALSSVSSSHSFSKSGSQSSSKSESYSGSHSFSKSGSYVLGHDGIPLQKSDSYSASKSQSSSNTGKSSSSESSSHTFSHNGALGIPLTLSEVSSQAASNSEHQSASDSSTHSFSNSAVVDDGLGLLQSFSKSGSQASSKSGLQSSSDASSHSFTNSGAVDVGLGAVQAFSQSGSQASSNSALQSSSDSSSHSFSNSGTVATGLGGGQSLSQSGSQAVSNSDHQASTQSSSNAFSNSGALDVGLGAVEGYSQSVSQAVSNSGVLDVGLGAVQGYSQSGSQAVSNSGALDVGLGAVQGYSQSGSQAVSNSDHQASTQSSSNAFSNSGALDVGLGAVQGYSQSGSQAVSNSGAVDVGLGAIEHFSQSGSEASSNGGHSSSSKSSSNSFVNSGALDTGVGSVHGSSSDSSSQAYSGSAGAGGSSQSYSGSESTSSAISHTASSDASSHTNSGAHATNLDTLSGHSLTEGGLLASLAQNQDTSTGSLGSQIQTSGINGDASYTQVILPQGANYDNQNSILDSTYIRSGIGQESQGELSESGAQISHVGFGQTASLTPPVEVSNLGGGSLTHIPVTNQGNGDSLVILSYHGGNDEQSRGHQENVGNRASYGNNYVLIGGRRVVSENPKVTPCHVCSNGGIEHITNIGQSQDGAVVQAPISTSYQTIVRPSGVQYETSVLNANNQQGNQDRSSVVFYHSLHPSGSHSQGHTTSESHSTGNANAYNVGDQHDVTIDRLNQFYGSNSPSYASFETQNVHVPSRTSLVTGINKGSTNSDNVVIIGNQSGGSYAGLASHSPTLHPAVENDKWTLEELIRSFNATPTVTTFSQQSVPVSAGSSDGTITAFGGNYLPPVQASVPVILPGSTSAASSHSSASSQSQQSSSSSHSSSTSSSGSISGVPVITPSATYLTPIETLGNLPVSHIGASNHGDGDIQIVQFGVPQSVSSSQSTSSSEASGNSQKSSSSSSSFSSSEGLQAGSGSASSSQGSSSSGTLDGSLGSHSSSQSSSFNGGSESLHHLVPSLGGLQHSIVSIGQQEANHELVKGSGGNSGHVQYIVPVFGSAGDHVSLGNDAHGVVGSTSSSSSGNVGDVQHSSGSSSTSSSSTGASGSHSSSDSSSVSGNNGSNFFGKIKTFFKRIPTYFKSSASSQSSSHSHASSSGASSHSYSSSSSSALS